METFLRCIEASGEACLAPAPGTLGGELEAGAGVLTQALVLSRWLRSGGGLGSHT